MSAFCVKVRRIWIVEMLDKGRWLPTVGCSLDKRSGQFETRRWEKNNPSEAFRLSCYIRRAQPRRHAGKGKK